MKKFAAAIVVVGLMFLLGIGLTTVSTKHEIIIKSLKKAIISKKGDLIIRKLNQISPITEKTVSENIWKRDFWVDVNGLWWRLEGRNLVDSFQVIRDDNGFLHQVKTRSSGMEALIQSSENLQGLALVARSINAQLLYVEAPTKILPDFGGLPEGIPEYSNSDADAFLKLARLKGIEVLDLRNTNSELPKSEKGLFFKTDHHWLPEAAFLAAITIDIEVKRIWGEAYDLDVPSPDSMMMKTWSNRFLGSLGIKTGRLFAGIDDFTVPFPKESGSFDFKHIGPRDKTAEYTGEFDKSLFDIPMMETGYVNVYMAFLHGGYIESQIVNNGKPYGLKILLIADSFGRSLAPYIALGVGEVRFLDPRTDRFSGNIAEYARNWRPDIIICMYNASAPYIKMNLGG